MREFVCVCVFQREIANLRRLCSEQGAGEDEVRRCKPRRRSTYSNPHAESKGKGLGVVVRSNTFT